MSTARISKKLHRLIARHEQLLDQLLHSPPMLRGSFTRVFTRCGKSTCWCAETPKGHLHTRLTWSENGKMITRKVPPDHVEEVIALTENYRKFRALRRHISSLQAQIHDVLNQYEADLIAKTRRPLSFLRINRKSQVTKSPGRRKTTGKENRKT